MASKENIITLPHKSLRQRSKKVGIVTSQIKQIIEDMASATLDWEASRKHEVGVALAAVQIDQLYRIVIVRNNFDDPKDKTFTVLINPEITKYEGEITKDHEGCLSIKELYGFVPRYEKVRVRAIDENGREFRMKVDGFLARILQHEIDHTNGILYIDHIKNDKHAFFRLDDDGHLIQLDHETVTKNNILW